MSNTKKYKLHKNDIKVVSDVHEKIIRLFEANLLTDVLGQDKSAFVVSFNVDPLSNYLDKLKDEVIRFLEHNKTLDSLPKH